MYRIDPSTIPANLVFSQDMYQSWIAWSRAQKSPGCGLSAVPRIPDHGEFFDFSNWLRPKSLVECTNGHPRHPCTATEFEELCPVCVMRTYIKHWELMEKAWARKNGGWGTVEERSNREYMQVKAAWYYAKKELTNAAIAMESYKQEELEWEAEHSGIDTSATYSATKAMGIANSIDHFPRSEVAADSTNSSEICRLQKEKTLRFAHEVVFNDNSARPTPQYNRKSPIYRPGRHACPEADGWRNTSHATSMRVTLMQMKVFLTFHESDLDTNKINHRDCKGILANHVLCDIVVHKVKMRMKGEAAGMKKDFKRLLSSSDAVLILNPQKTEKDGNITYDFQDLKVFSLLEEREEAELHNVRLPDDGGPMDLDEPCPESPKPAMSPRYGVAQTERVLMSCPTPSLGIVV